MRTVTLKRFRHGDDGTFSKVRGGLTLYCGEPPWRDNKNGISCIPPGPGKPKKKYKVKYCWSRRFKKKMYLITGIKGRKGVRIHSGNFVGDKKKKFKSDSLGCPILGKKYGYLGKQRAILASKSAVKQFEKHMNYEDFWLEVMNG